jgi:hypothetical protein
MSRRLDWQKARFVGRPTLDFRREFEFEDRAAKWLRRAESHPQSKRTLASDLRHQRRRAVSVPAKVQRRTMAIAEQLGESSDWVTAVSSAEVPW